MHEKKLNLTYNLKNEDYNHSEIPLCTCLIGEEQNCDDGCAAVDAGNKLAPELPPGGKWAQLPWKAI